MEMEMEIGLTVEAVHLVCAGPDFVIIRTRGPLPFHTHKVLSPHPSPRYGTYTLLPIPSVVDDDVVVSPALRVSSTPPSGPCQSMRMYVQYYF